MSVSRSVRCTTVRWPAQGIRQDRPAERINGSPVADGDQRRHLSQSHPIAVTVTKPSTCCASLPTPAV